MSFSIAILIHVILFMNILISTLTYLQELLARALDSKMKKRNGFLVFGGAFTSRDAQKLCLFDDDPLHLNACSHSDLALPEDLGIDVFFLCSRCSLLLS